MPAWKVQVTYPNGYAAMITSGNSYPPPPVRYYTQAQLDEALASFRSNPSNAQLTFEAVPA